jgi:hypothetical protein
VALIQSVAWDREMRPFDCYRAWLRTDRIRIDIEVAEPGDGADASGSRWGQG